MRVSHILFDLDNTLYRASGGMFDEIKRRMTAFTARHFGISEDEATAVRRDYTARYGTTLGGLLGEGGLADPEEYLAVVHPEDVGPYIIPDPGLRGALQSLPHPKSIITNSPREHAERVLESLSVSDCFGRIFDIRSCGFAGKPQASAYRSALDALGLPAGRVLLLDDATVYLEAYIALGGPAVQVREDGVPTGDWPCLRDVKELPGWLEGAGEEVPGQ
ncbi:MAG: pyrimidine 5'-nucleotidase [Spirochaetales bacterium]|nr:pyrimidine 5'-nucleotidase [Spirochaetales bacterium]